MKHLIEEFASSNLFGKDNYEYYARVTGRVLRVQGEWICSFQYPPAKGMFSNEYIALERYLLGEYRACASPSPLRPFLVLIRLFLIGPRTKATCQWVRRRGSCAKTTGATWKVIIRGAKPPAISTKLTIRFRAPHCILCYIIVNFSFYVEVVVAFFKNYRKLLAGKITEPPCI